ncbi:SMP-30/gluconolactonase/LRE family protein [Amycolatopsis sp. K13G38]|uniref:SMP-30/gluconolactonase/LRE family protein n=1 Tax=Amycolatopsis acididurans TaxID=2724524 RepID=A0ABX1J5J1_9PSEU|nr:SMP-30/gluconolactonase/LRE family protein [Amycolatopsis acididurans]NKQ55067.1 SMP-30/gluconolactonase/LRE family protein [Amycolatopsis acididurans]
MSAQKLRVKATPVLEVASELGESPLWENDIGLRWLDVPGRRPHTLDRGGRHTSVALPVLVTAIEPGAAGDLLAVTSTGFAWLDPRSGRIEQFADVVEPPVSMNSAAIDGRGRCWAGSAVRDDSRGGALYRLARRSVTTHLEKISMSSGIGWSPDNRELYHVDSGTGTLTGWRYNVFAGDLHVPRLLRRIPAETGMPCGLAVAEDGGIWLAVRGAGQVWRLDPGTGETTALVEVPTPYVTSCAFGGAELSTLYITTANHESPGGGLLYAAEVSGRGLPAHRFAGGV